MRASIFLEVRVEFRLLGPVEVWHDGQMMIVGPRQQRHVLAILAVEAGKLVPSETLIDRLWDEAPHGARHTLHVHLSRIRALMRQSAAPYVTAVQLIGRDGGYLLDAQPDLVDIHRFRGLVADARTGDHSSRERVDLLGRALSLWRGEPLSGLRGQWAACMRQGWLQQYLEVVVEWAQDQIVLGDPAVVVDRLTEVTSQHPFVEPVASLLMQALAAAGRQTDALEYYVTFRQRLAEELGVDPGGHLQATHQKILRGHGRSSSTVAVSTASPGHLVLASSGTRDAGGAPAASVVPDVVYQTPVPAQLPADVPSFTGRVRHLAALDTLLAGGRADTPGDPADSDGSGRLSAVVISAVSGTAGVGKTALAVHWAHRVRHRFPDGQLYVNLRGFDPSGVVMNPGEVIAGFLDALGVPPQRIPSTLDARVGLYRSLLAGKRVLVLLDNARDAQQVRPLLPAAPTALAVVTSRNQLTPLTAVDGACPMSLDLLSAAEARKLLAQRLGTERVEADPHATEQIIAACARLPLALAIVAARAQTSGYPLAVLAAELGDAGGRLDALDAGDTMVEVRAVFSWSYATLTADAARLFRLLGLHPGPDFCAMAAASLAGRPWRQVRRWLAELVTANLLTKQAPDRYSCHDLLHAYAAETAYETDAVPEREAAHDRLLDFYLHTAATAAGYLAPHASPCTGRVPPPAEALAGRVPSPAEALAGRVSSPAEALAMASREQASEWFTREQSNLVAAAGWAAAHGRTAAAVGIPAALHEHLRAHGPWTLALDLYETALTAARYADDGPGQAQTLANLADTQHLTNDFAAAISSAGQALDLYRRLGDPFGEARALNTLGLVRLVTGDYVASVATLGQALELCRRLGDQLGEAKALDTLGRAQYITADYPASAVTAGQALDLCRRLGDRFGQVSALNTLGLGQLVTGDHAASAVTTQEALDVASQLGDRLGQLNAMLTLGIVQHATGDYPAAAGTAERALDLSRQLGMRLGQANALQTLGRVQHASGDHATASASLGRALDLFREVGDPDGEAETLNHIGQLMLDCATPAAAHRSFAAALEIARAIGTQSHEARSLQGLGDCALRDGRHDEGVTYLRHALAICRGANCPHTAQVEAALEQASRLLR